MWKKEEEGDGKPTLWGIKPCAIAVLWPETESTASLIDIPPPYLILLDLTEEVKPVKGLKLTSL